MLGEFKRFLLAASALPWFVAASALPASAEPLVRAGQTAGAVIARKSGEEVRFIDVSDWRFVDLKQDLVSGDVLRTNETGQLAIVFSDRTQIRLGRNSTLAVKQVTASTSADTVLQLQTGTIWARAERGGPGVKVETPAAAAAIRGTDWTMTVNGANTSLNVLEGTVQLSNPQGSVEVRQGEGAVASIGQAPRKVVIVDSDDREQMLFYLPPREAFDRMPPSAMPVAQMRRNADRIAAKPPGQRSTEDWVTLAEAQLSLEGRAKAQATLGMIEGKSLSASQKSRVTLINAILAATDGRYGEAAKLFESSQRGLDPKRRGIALYGGYYARALANPNHVERLPPQVGGPAGAFLRAYAIGFLKDLKSAIQSIKDAERQYPDDPELPAYRGWLALLLNDRAQAKEALDRSLALDPNEPTALEGRSHFRAGFLSDNKGALADLEAVLKVTPGSSGTWNAIGNLQSERGANREAEAAFRKAIELDPKSPVTHANLAIFYLDTGRMEDAKREIDIAMAVDPAFDITLIARGRYYLQMGETDKAIDDLLAGSVANPAYSQGALLLAAAHYIKGDRVAAEQATDNADRLDANDPVIAAMRTAVAIDKYDADGAIRNAQEYLRRSRARGGDYSSIGANQQAGSTLNAAFRLQGMDAWAEYYSDAAFDPFAGMSYADQALRGSANPFANSYIYGQNSISNGTNGQAFSSVFQALLLDPSLISSPSRGVQILPQPFFEASLGGGITTAGGEVGYTATAEIQGYGNLPFPVSYYADIQWQRVPDSRDAFASLTDVNTQNKILGGNLFLAASPTIDDRVVLYYNDAKSKFHGSVTDPASPLVLFGFPDPTLYPLLRDQEITSRVTNGGIGWSHTFGYKDVMNAALLYSGIESRDRRYLQLDVGFPLPVFGLTDQTEQKSYIAAVNHAVGVENLTWRYGIEGGWIDARQFTGFDNLLPPILGGPASFSVTAADRTTVGRAYVDLLHEIRPDLKAEYALFGSYLDDNTNHVTRLEPRAGIAWSPAEGQWLRAGFIRSSIDLTTPTLSPIGIVGLQPNQVSVATGGYVDTYAFRWDAEWTPDLFTAVEYQHQDLKDPRITVPLASTSFNAAEGRIDRGAVSANVVLGQGFGLSSTVAYTHSRNDDPASPTFGRALPFIPEWGGQVALTWVNEANVKAKLAANYIGQRDSDAGIRLDDYWTLDANLTWEPFGKRFEMELAAYNLLDEKFEVNSGQLGWGRSFKGTLKVRF